MDVRCAACGEPNPARARFCLACGTPIAAQEPAGAREVRRTLTVLFADMVGFTSLGERLDQESLRRVMDRFYAEMRDAIEARGGTVAKFIGDAVMAVWGTPLVHEDDALRAVQAAEDMRSALRALNDDLDRRWGVRIGLRTGVNTGEVVVDPTKSADLLVGDTLNVAARLEQAAADGEVLVGGETYRLVRDAAQLEPVAPLDLKGKARPLPAWRLVDGLRPEHHPGPRMQAPLVGRGAEIARLRAAFYAATGARATRMVTVIGSPGVGKTRLTSEFAKKAGDEALVLRGRCEAQGEGLTFLPIIDVLRAAAGIADGDTMETARRKLAVLVEGDDERDRIVDRAFGLLGGPAVGVEETFWAVRRLLESLAARQPVVLVLDDVHWAQPTLLDLLEHLVRWGHEAPLLVVAVARPELRDVRPAFTASGPLASDVLELGPLRGEDSRVLVGRLLGEADLPAPLAARVLETTEGNPLFLGEMLRMLVDDGVLRREGDSWVAADTSVVAVPPTIHALLAARIARLSDAERCVVERAAVIGQHFYRGAVAELSPPEVRATVDEHLDALRRKELVAPEATIWLDEPVFRFHHVLVRDAAYRSLLKEARADLHERFAAWLEGKGDDVDEQTGFHLERAYAYRQELGPLDASGRALGERAADRLHAAGCRALEREDLPAARNLLGRALGPLDPADPRRARVLIDLAEALVSAGDAVEAENVIEELALRSERDPVLQAWATAYACQLALLAGAAGVSEAIDRATAAAATLADAGDARGAAKAHHVAATGHALLGQVAAAEASLDHALVAARSAEDRRRVTAVLAGAPRAALWGPSPVVRASGRCLDVVRILRMTPGNRHVEAVALRSQAVLEAMRGRFDAARDILAGCRATLEELGLTLELHEVATYAGIVELLAGDPATAERELRAARDGFVALGVEGDAARASALLARALLEQGRDAEAEEETRFTEMRAGDDLKSGTGWRGVRAQALARRGEVDEALALAREAVERAETTDALPDRADALLALAEVLEAADRHAEALEAARQARDVYAAKDHQVGVARVDALLRSDTDAHGFALPDGGYDPTEIADALPTQTAWKVAAETGNFDALAALYGDDYVLVDHRFNQAPIVGREAGVELVRDIHRMAEGDVRFTITAFRHAGTDPHIEASTFTVTAGGREGVGDWEVRYSVVAIVRDSRIRRAEIFEPDSAAFDARFRELAARVELDARRRPVPPEAERRHEETQELLNRRDFEGFAAMVADDFALRDLRERTVWAPIGRHEFLATTHAMREEMPGAHLEPSELLGGLGNGDVTVLAGFQRLTGDTGSGPWDLGWGFVEVLHDGRLATVDIVDADADVVLAHFDSVCRRVLGLTLSPHASEPIAPEAVALRGRAQLALVAGDPTPVSDLWHEDVERVDRRPLGLPDARGKATLFAETFAALDAAAEVAIDEELVAAAWEGDTLVIASRHRFRGTPHGAGGPVEASHAQVVVARDGRFVRIEMLPDDVELLRDHYTVRRRLAPVPEPLRPQGAAAAVRGPRDPSETPLVRVRRAFGVAFAARDWIAVGALYADDAVLVDHRPEHVSRREGRAAILDLLRSIVDEAPGVRWREHPVRTAGPRLLVSTVELSGTQAAFLFHADTAGLVRRIEVHPALESAIERLELLRSWEEGMGRWTDALAALDASAAWYTPDCRVIDHRSGMRDEFSGRDRLLTFWRMADAIEIEVTVEVLEAAPFVAATTLQMRGRGEHGGAWANDALQVVRVNEDLIAEHVEIFDFGDRAALIDRFMAVSAAVERAQA